MRAGKISGKCLGVLSVLSALGLMFSTTASAQANGAKIVSEIDSAQTLIDFSNSHEVCSSIYIANATLRADCVNDVAVLTSIVDAWDASFEAGTLTVAYDAATESNLYAYENALGGVLNAAGFSYSGAAVSRGKLAPNFQIAPDEITPDANGVVCAACGGSAAAGYYVCLTTIEAPPVALVCGVGVALGYLACAWDACIEPPDPPQMCPV